MYKALWIDDQCNDKDMIQFVINAENNGIELNGYTSFEEGFTVLEKNLESYDVILLDGLFFEKIGQEVGTEDVSGIVSAIAKIHELKNQKGFQWFILSGKDKFTKGGNDIVIGNKAQCFDKTNPSDIKKLFEEMKNAAKNQPDYHLKHKYEELLKICDDKYIGADQFDRVFSFIKDISNNEKIGLTQDKLNAIRKILEALFCRLNKLGVIPSEIIDNKGWINKSGHFLSNYKYYIDYNNKREFDYSHLEEFIHPLTAENIHRLLNIIQDASHGEGRLPLKVDEYLKEINSDFLYKSCIYLLFEILNWFKDFIDKNGDIEENMLLWERKKKSLYKR